MAESNRRGEDAAAEHVDDVFDDAVDDDAQEAEDDAPVGRSRSAAATKARPKAAGKADERKVAKRSDGNVVARFFSWIGSIPGRIWRFILEVVGELRKVIWPTRKDLLTYTAVVVVFVAIMLTIVGTVDVIFAKAVLLVFGNS